MNIIKTSDYRIDNTGTALVTAELQDLIDRAAEAKGTLLIEKGTYLTASLFLKSDMHLVFEEGARLLATTDESQYPILPSRIAGIEMDWYPALLNCIGQKHVTVSGNGVLDGQGAYWWAKFWGPDRKGGLLAEYEPRGLRWATDYDAMRLRNVVVSDSEDITLKDFTSYKAGFWNVHVYYSQNVHIDGLKILCGGLNEPSTDGIDIDSCSDVLIENCETHTHDDSICIKSGRDSDGLRVNIPCKHIRIRNCKIYEGFGITLGSEVSGGIEDVVIEDTLFRGSDCGFRIKSTYKRKGYIRNIKARNLQMENVLYPVYVQLNWFPLYNSCSVGEDYQGEIPEHWKKLMAPVSDEIPPTIVEDISIQNVHAVLTEDFKGVGSAFVFDGYPDMPIRNVTMKDMDISCNEYGLIRHIENLRQDNVKVTVTGSGQEERDRYANV